MKSAHPADLASATLRVLALLTLTPAAPAQFAAPAVLADGTPGDRDFCAWDIDRDGDEDLVGKRQRSAADPVRWFLRENLGGTFAEPRLIEGPGDVYGPYVHDLDGDGFAEAVTVENLGFSNRVRSYAGSLTGFGAPTSVGGSFPSTGFVYDVEVADLDADGAVEVLVVTYLGSNNGIYLARGTSPGVFGLWERIVAGRNGGVVTGDFDGDGVLDLAYGMRYPTGSQSFPLKIGFVQGAIDPSGRWEVASRIPPLASLPWDGRGPLESADLDGNGISDLVFVGGGATSAINRRENHALGQGNFSFTVTAHSNSFSTLSSVYMRLVDLDLDGFEDIVVGSHDRRMLRWRRGRGDGTFAPEAAFAADAEYTLDLVLVDADGDGRVDLYHSGYLDNPRVFHIGVFPNQSSPGSVAFGPRSELQPPLGRLRTLTSGDLNGDGLVELVLVEDGVGQIVIEDQVQPLEFTRREFALAASTDAELVDLDQDGDLDLVTSSLFGSMTTSYNDGTGQFFVGTISAWPGENVCWILAVDDLDGDGIDDVLVQGGTVNLPVTGWQAGLLWGRGDGLGGFDTPTWLFPLGGACDRETVSHVDVTADGVRDLVYRDGAGLFGYRPRVSPATFGDFVPLGPEGAGGPIRLADLDGDGDEDFLLDGSTVSAASNELVWYEATPAGIGARNVLTASPVGLGARTRGLVDVDDDGDEDLVAVGSTGVIVYERFAPAGFALPVNARPTDSFAWSRAEFVDLEGDGDVDLFVASPGGSPAYGFIETLALPSLGTSICGPAMPNSTGVPGELHATGRTSADANLLELRAGKLPIGATTLFLASPTSGPPVPIAGTAGALCLTGNIGRMLDRIQVSSTGGHAYATLDLDAITLATGVIAVAPGQTLNFQAWHRDVVGGQATSNLTDAVRVTFD